MSGRRAKQLRRFVYDDNSTTSPRQYVRHVKTGVITLDGRDGLMRMRQVYRRFKALRQHGPWAHPIGYGRKVAA